MNHRKACNALELGYKGDVEARWIKFLEYFTFSAEAMKDSKLIHIPVPCFGSVQGLSLRECTVRMDTYAGIATGCCL